MIDLRPERYRQEKDLRSLRLIAIILIVFTVLSTGAAHLLLRSRVHSSLHLREELEAEMAVLRELKARVENKKEAVEKAQGRLDRFEALSTPRDWASLLRRLAGWLPPDTWLERIDFREERLKLRVVTAKKRYAAEYLEELEAASDLVDLELERVLRVPYSDLDVFRFTLEASLKNHMGVPRGE